VGLLHGGVGQADEDEAEVAGLAGVDLDLDGDGVDTLKGGGEDGGEHAAGVCGLRRQRSG